MRVEATIEEWKALYEAATRIHELKPWDVLWDMDIIGVQTGEDPESMAFYSILGKGGDCYGVAVYEGYDGLNTLMMLTMQERMNLPLDYVMFNRQNLTCYWGDREELSTKQRQVIKELGYKYRGKNNWLYFMSYEPGYYPYNPDRDQVIRMTGHLKNLDIAFTQYKDTAAKVKFDDGNMFACLLSKDSKSWKCSEEPLPFLNFHIGSLLITDEEVLADLARMPQANIILEADARPLGVSVADKKYDRPANPSLCILAEAQSGIIISGEMTEPADDPMVELAETVIGFIFQHGAPKEIRVTNVIVEAALKQISEICKIKLRRVKRLTGVEEFLMSFKGF